MITIHLDPDDPEDPDSIAELYVDVVTTIPGLVPLDPIHLSLWVSLDRLPSVPAAPPLPEGGAALPDGATARLRCLGPVSVEEAARLLVGGVTGSDHVRVVVAGSDGQPSRALWVVQRHAGPFAEERGGHDTATVAVASWARRAGEAAAAGDAPGAGHALNRAIEALGEPAGTGHVAYVETNLAMDGWEAVHARLRPLANRSWVDDWPRRALPYDAAAVPYLLRALGSGVVHIDALAYASGESEPLRVEVWVTAETDDDGVLSDPYVSVSLRERQDPETGEMVRVRRDPESYAVLEAFIAENDLFRRRRITDIDS